MTAVRCRRDGYSLMEAIVALFILSIAASGFLIATQAHIDGVRGLEDRIVGQWVAENRLTELALGDATPDVVRTMGVDWSVRVKRTPTDDADLQAVEIVVSRANASGGTARLNGFIDVGAVS